MNQDPVTVSQEGDNATDQDPVTVSREGNVLFFKLTGEFDYGLVKLFKHSFQAEEKAERYVLDLQMVDKITSAAVGGLMFFHQFVGGDSTDITLINTRPKVERLLKLAQLHKKFKFE
ncbi:MAG: STAS domain-containing protein [Magnetococcales bacterium]|nr:STAS domain-containing protein [Magnetococcales bacterium]